MSKIFEALQRSVTERSGRNLSDAPQIVSDLLLQAETFDSPSEKTPPHLPDRPLAAEHFIPDPRLVFDVESSSILVPKVTDESRLIAITEPDGMAAERFRQLSVRLREFGQRGELKRLLITSAVPDEGKSVMAINLACTLGRYKNARVLLVEGDIRRPRILADLNLPIVKGLSEWLRSDLESPEVIYRINHALVNFWLLPAGEPLNQPVEHLESGRLAVLLDRLTQSFDWIIIDSPPILPVADATVWARLSQGILMVARERRTEKKQLQTAIQGIDASKVLGLILNDATEHEHSRYYNYYSCYETHPSNEL